MRKTIYVLSLLILVLGTWLVVLWLPSFTPQEDDRQETRYGLNEGLELVEQDNGKEGKRYVVEDADGKELFVIPLRNSLLDTRFRNGQLRFREQVTHREGFIDRQGMVTFTHEGFVSIHENNKNLKTTSANTLSEDPLIQVRPTKGQQLPYTREHLWCDRTNCPIGAKRSHKWLSTRWHKTTPSTRKQPKSCKAS